MTRVYHRSHAAAVTSSQQRAKARKKKPYKILLESVTQEKKKLHSTVSYNARAPHGYLFVPAGTPELTEFCKELCRKRGLIAHVVSAKPKHAIHTNPEKVSHHVHRIGHHFPSEVVEQACDWLGYRFHRGVYQKATRNLGSTLLDRSLADNATRLGLHNRPVTELETSQQIKASILDLFPKIPEADADSIVKHAFREGTDRVGNAPDMPLSRRVQLAVLAHIRHEYTDYDQLLKTDGWLEARARVEPVCLAQLMKWRGEDDGGVAEMEETFREVIVLDDDDDEDEDASSDELSSTDGRERSIEIFSHQAAARDLQPDDLHDVEWIDRHDTVRAPGKAYFIRPQPRKVRAERMRPSGAYQSLQVSRPPLEPRGSGSRVQLTYDNARAAPLPSQSSVEYIRGEPHPQHVRRSTYAYEDVRLQNPSNRHVLPGEPLAPTNPPPVKPKLEFRDKNGVLYKLQPVNDYGASRQHHSLDTRIGSHGRRDFIERAQPISLSSRDLQSPRNARSIPESDVVLPSIERDVLDSAEPWHTRKAFAMRNDQESTAVASTARRLLAYPVDHGPSGSARPEQPQYPKRRHDFPEDLYESTSKYPNTNNASITSPQRMSTRLAGRDGQLYHGNYGRVRYPQAEVVDLTSPRRYVQRVPGEGLGRPIMFDEQTVRPIQSYSELRHRPPLRGADERRTIMDDGRYAQVID